MKFEGRDESVEEEEEDVVGSGKRGREFESKCKYKPKRRRRVWRFVCESDD